MPYVRPNFMTEPQAAAIKLCSCTLEAGLKLFDQTESGRACKTLRSKMGNMISHMTKDAGFFLVGVVDGEEKTQKDHFIPALQIFDYLCGYEIRDKNDIERALKILIRIVKVPKSMNQDKKFKSYNGNNVHPLVRYRHVDIIRGLKRKMKNGQIIEGNPITPRDLWKRIVKDLENSNLHDIEEVYRN